MYQRRAFLSLRAAYAALPTQAQFKRVEGGAVRTTVPTPQADTEADATFRVDVDVVNVLASVRDPNGAIVSNLAKEDFQLLDDGVEREIRYFTRQSDLPLTIGILVDTSRSQANVLEEQREAAYQFLGRVLRPEQDQAFVIKFDREVELLQGLTASRKDLERAIGRLGNPGGSVRPVLRTPMASDFQIRIGLPGGRRPGGRGTPGGDRGGDRTPQPGGSSTGGTHLYDAVYLAADEVLAKESGRKAILLISDGVDYGSRISRGDAAETSQRADSLVYSILYMDPRVYNRKRIRERGRGALQFLSSETGGAMFEVTEDLSINEVFAQIEEELRNQYSLGFTPSAGTPGAQRQLELRVRDKKLTVRARKSYYTKAA
jgi:VWFA-related protein